MSEFRVNSITNQDGSEGPQVCGVSTFSGKSGVQIPSGSSDFRRQDGGGRGRGMIGGSYPAPTRSDIQFIEIATKGNSQNFGEVTTLSKTGAAAVASSTRACFMAGEGTTTNTGHISNVIDFVTISTLGNAQDFGDTTVAVNSLASASNSTRGLHAGGRTGSPVSEALKNDIGFITIESAGNATDFGDLVTPTRYLSGCSDAHGGLIQ